VSDGGHGINQLFWGILLLTRRACGGINKGSINAEIIFWGRSGVYHARPPGSETIEVVIEEPISSVRKVCGIGALLLLLLVAESSMAVPACPWGAEVIQPDGTEITVYLRGDEYAHWNESEDGFLITKDKKSGEWVYMVEDTGKAVASGHAVGKADARTIGALRPDKKKLSAQAEQNRADKQMVEGEQTLVLQTGTMRNLVVLVDFSDLTVAYPQQDYNDLFNQVGYTADGAAGSVKDYYNEISYNELTVQSTVVEAVTLDNGYAYYGANVGGSDVRPREMVQQALAKLEARGFDFSTMDGDSDGWVDGLTIIHAGGGEEYSGNDSDYIWSHQWSLISPVTYDGVSMQMYHTEPARRGWDAYPSTQGITRIGVICHENGHFLGLPDLYDYGYDSKGAGDFCLMAGGSWNGNYGTTPAHMSAWCRSDLGWVSSTAISSSGSYSLEQVETSAQVYKLQGGFPSTQYFLVENRQGVGFDAGLPGSLRGILIWHVDETQANNNNQAHYKVDLEEGSGTQHLELNQNDGDDADYFRAGNATMFTENSTPNNLSYGGQMLGINITDVGASGASMLITIEAVPPGKATSPSPADLAAGVGVTADISWTAGSGATSHDVYFGTTNPPPFQVNQAGTTFDTGTMSTSTTYYWRIDEKNAVGTTTGDLWSFTTTSQPAVSIIGSWISGTTNVKMAGANRALVFIAHAEDNSDPSIVLNTVSYGGQAMTKVLEGVVGGAAPSSRAYVAAFILDEAGIAAASGNSFAGSWNQTPDNAGYSSVFLENVNQTALTGAADSNGVTDTRTVATAALSANYGDMILCAATSSSTGEYTPNNGFTEAIEVTINNADGYGGYKLATGAAETPSVSHSDSTQVRHVIIGFVVKAMAVPDMPPAAPTGLAATAGSQAVSLNWDDNTEPDLAGYNVYRSTTSGSGYDKLNFSIMSDSNYTDNTVINGIPYYYVVTAVDANDQESDYSNEASAVPAYQTCEDVQAGGDRLASDLTGDCYVDFQDVEVIADYWLNTDCSTPYNCGGADFEPSDGTVDFLDFSDFAVQWLQCNDPEGIGCTPNW
jgi:M6 family metalloprotease-like protein